MASGVPSIGIGSRTFWFKIRTRTASWGHPRRDVVLSPYTECLWWNIDISDGWIDWYMSPRQFTDCAKYSWIPWIYSSSNFRLRLKIDDGRHGNLQCREHYSFGSDRAHLDILADVPISISDRQLLKRVVSTKNEIIIIHNFSVSLNHFILFRDGTCVYPKWSISIKIYSR